MARDYLSHSATAGTTASLGWYVEDGGRVADPPSPRQYVIDSIPYRSGEIDVSDVFGIGPTYPMRELEYRLIGKFASNAAAHTASDSLVAWARSCRHAELYDSIGGCTFTNATFTGASVDDMGTAQRVTLKFKANPFKKGGSL